MWTTVQLVDGMRGVQCAGRSVCDALAVGAAYCGGEVRGNPTLFEFLIPKRTPAIDCARTFGDQKLKGAQGREARGRWEAGTRRRAASDCVLAARRALEPTSAAAVR